MNVEAIPEATLSERAAIAFGVAAAVCTVTAVALGVMIKIRNLPAWTTHLYQASFIAVTPFFAAAMLTGCNLKTDKEVEEESATKQLAFQEALDLLRPFSTAIREGTQDSAEINKLREAFKTKYSLAQFPYPVDESAKSLVFNYQKL